MSSDSHDGREVRAGGGVADGDEDGNNDDEEFYDPEPLPILGRCKALYPFEGELNLHYSHSMGGVILPDCKHVLIHEMKKMNFTR